MKFSGVDFPVLIRGEKGTGKQLAAFSIHLMSTRRDAPFISVSCNEWDESNITERFIQAYTKANGGTLLLRHLNELPRNLLLKIQHHWEREYMEQTLPVRLMCTFSSFRCQGSNEDNNDNNENSDEMIESSAPWLSLQPPCLAHRADDIPELLTMFQEKYSNIKKLKFNHESIALLKAHQWQDNVKGLERLYARVAVLADSTEIDKQILIEICPEMANIQIPEQEKLVQFEQKDSPKLGENTSVESFDGLDAPAPIVSSLLDKQIPDVGQCHMALSRSLDFIMNQYNEKITIDHVAETACVSSPHLSFLFRKHLGVSFRQLLLQVRIEQSKKLLRSQPNMQITQISYETGFHDLSHFEKTFRKLVGVKPSQYRRHVH